MKKRFILLMIIGIGLLGSPVAIVHGQEAVSVEEATEPVLKPEDVQEIREAAKAIRQIVGNFQETAQTDTQAGPVVQNTTPAQPVMPEKNMAEVADKALSILSNYIGSAANAMQKVAPEVWRVMIRQQYANAIAEPFVPLALIGFTGLFCAVTKKWWWKERFTDSDEAGAYFIITSIIPFIAVIVLGIWASIALKGSVQMLINPEYYAFRDLLQLILQKGSI